MSGRKRVDRAIGPRAGSVGTVTSNGAGGYLNAVRVGHEGITPLMQGEVLCFTGQCSSVAPRRFAAVRSSGQLVWLDIDRVRRFVWVEGWRVPWQRFKDRPRTGLKCKT